MDNQNTTDGTFSKTLEDVLILVLMDNQNTEKWMPILEYVES